MIFLKVSEKEAVRLIVILVISKIFFWDINRFVYYSASAAWINAVLTTAFTALLFLILKYAYSKNNCADVFDCIKTAYGKTGLIIAGTLLFIMQILNFAVVLRIYSNTISTITLTSMPSYFVLIFILITVIAAGYYGIENLIKLTSVSCCAIVAFITALFLFDIPHFDFTNIFPVFGNGLSGFLKCYKNVGFYNELLFLLFLVPLLKERKNFGKIGFKSIAYSGIIIILTALVYTLTSPYPANTQFYLPVLEISSEVNISVIFQRAESIFLILWIFTCFIYLGASFCFMLYTFEKTFGIKDKKAIIGAVLIISVTLLDLFENINEANPLYRFMFYAFAVSLFVFFTLTFFISAHRRKKEK